MISDSKKFLINRMLSEDTSDGKTPRSGSQCHSESTHDGQSPKNSSGTGSRRGSKSEDDLLDDDQRSISDDENTDGENAYGEDEYNAFLRELAGSFEATREDDESEVSSDSGGSSDEDEEGQTIGRKRSSMADELPDNGWPASPPFAGRGRACGLGSPEAQEELAKVNGNLEVKGTTAQPSRVGYPVANMARYVGPAQGRQGPIPPNPLVAASQGATGSDALCKRPKQLATPLTDNRPPVVDDYDVAMATAEYAEQRLTLSRLDRQREDLLVAIKLRQDQANKLLTMSCKQHLGPELRSHYSEVRLELLNEAQSLEDQLKALLEAQDQASLLCSCAAMMSHQETPFGAAPSVVVQ